MVPMMFATLCAFGFGLAPSAASFAVDAGDRRDHLGLLQRAATATELGHMLDDEVVQLDAQLDDVVGRAGGPHHRSNKRHALHAYEGCHASERAGARAASLQEKRKQRVPQHAEHNASGAGDCQGSEIALFKESFSGVATSCCSADLAACGGCETESGGKCTSCVGGYQLEDGQCTMCADTAGWLNDAGDSCFSAECTDTLRDGLSAMKACCKCGGGQRAATPFSFQAVNVVIGTATVPASAVPMPRTAMKYSVDTECALSDYGLSLNGETGALELGAGCSSIGCGKTDAFQVSCTLTAHQTAQLNATATLTVNGVSFGYPSSVMVGREVGMLGAPWATSASDYKLACVPSNAHEWLEIASDGRLQLTKQPSAGSAGITGLGDLGIVGARCAVTATLVGEKVTTSISVLVPQFWTDFEYARSKVIAAIGESSLPIKIKEKSASLLAPGRYSVACDVADGSAGFAFDTTTGVATLDGHFAFMLDTSAGTLQVMPSKSLSNVFDDMSMSNIARKSMTLNCKVYGYYKDPQAQNSPRYATSTELELVINDNVCWAYRMDNFSGRNIVGTGDKPFCAKSCRASPTCTDFGVHGGTCFIYDGACTLGEKCFLQNHEVYSKVPNCGERSTCLHITDANQKWISGKYCPVGDSFHGPVYHKFGSTIQETLYLAAYDETRDGKHDTCEPGLWVLKQADPKLDFSDPDSNYIELQGATVKCIEGEGTPIPTPVPTPSPTKSPTLSPTDSPTPSPTDSPTMSPTDSPTASPTRPPTTVSCGNFGGLGSICSAEAEDDQYPNVWKDGVICKNAIKSAWTDEHAGSGGLHTAEGCGKACVQHDGCKFFAWWKNPQASTGRHWCNLYDTCDFETGSAANVYKIAAANDAADSSKLLSLGEGLSEEACRDKCVGVGQHGCCEFSTNGFCSFRYDAFVIDASIYTTKKTFMCAAPTQSPTPAPTDSPTPQPTNVPTDATCDADFGATRNVCASKENPSVNWHGMAGGSEKHYFGNTYSKASCAQKCKDFGQSGCCEYRGSGVCVFKVDGSKRYSSGHSDAQTMMCRPAIEVPATEATCDADFGATRNVCASKENPSVNWHGMAGGSEKHYFGNTYNKASCAQKCKDFGQAGCCEYRGSGVCVFKVDGLKRYSSGHSDAQTLMCSPATEVINLESRRLEMERAPQDFVATVFKTGRFITNVAGTLAGRSCGAPNTTMVHTSDLGEAAGSVPILVLDDPVTAEPADHWMHPCECFPKTWGVNPPVTQESYDIVPAGSGNMFQPDPFEIVTGSYTCEEDALIGHILIEDERSAQDPSYCYIQCQSNSLCRFFWRGEAGGIGQCRLFKRCQMLVNEGGGSGSLKAMPDANKQYCRVADPEKCWSTTARRGYLDAADADKDVKCEWGDLIGQCDHKMMLGGHGIEACGRCTYMDASKQKFAHKVVLPAEFPHGKKLGVTCWSERYREVSANPGAARTGETLTCVSGSWLDSKGRPGLSEFACGACVQVVSPKYAELDSADKQESYFTARQAVQLIVRTETPRVLTKEGKLEPLSEYTRKFTTPAPAPSFAKYKENTRCGNYKVGGQWVRTFLKDAHSINDCFRRCTEAGNCDHFTFGYEDGKANCIYTAPHKCNVESFSGFTTYSTSYVDVEVKTNRVALGPKTSSVCPVNWVAIKSPKECEQFAKEANFVYNYSIDDENLPADCHYYSGEKQVKFNNNSGRSVQGNPQLCKALDADQATVDEATAAEAKRSDGSVQVLKLAQTTSDDVRVVESVEDPDSCLSASISGVAPQTCGTPPGDGQRVLVGDLPSIVGRQMEAKGFLPAPKSVEVGTPYTSMKFTDITFEQDCGDFAVNSFGWADEDENGKLETFGACAIAGTVGQVEPHIVTLGGAFDLEYSICGKGGDGTSNKIAYFLNNIGRRDISGGTGQGTRTRVTINYYEPFEKLNVNPVGWNGDKDVRFCRFRLGGQNLPTAALNVNVGVPSVFSESNPLTVTGNRMPQELAFARVECGDGQALGKIALTRTKFEFTCRFISTLGACRPVQTEQSDTSSGTFSALTQLKMICDHGSVLQKLVAEASSGGQWLRYRYTCCSTGGLPLSIMPTGGFVDGRVKEFEGIYCPTSRDTSGRLSFERTFAFLPSDAGNQRTLTFDRDAMKWCVGTECRKGDGAHPLDDRFTEQSTWEVVAVSDFDGKFEVSSTAKENKKKGPRKMPKLIKFGATEPEYAKECKDEVMPDMVDSFNVAEMNKVGLALPDGNPCKLVAGGWDEDGNGFGSSYWSTHAYNGDSTEKGAGTTYDSVRGCADREISRALKAGKWDLQHDMIESVMGFTEGKVSAVCGFLPDVEAAPFGFGIGIGVGDLCESLVGLGFSIGGFMNDKTRRDDDWAMAKDDNADCNSLQHGLSRVFCDLHCIRDAVKAGDVAILDSLEGASKVVAQNVDLLLEYYTGVNMDALEAWQESKQESQLNRARDVSNNVKGMFREMRRHLAAGSSALSPAGRASATRALDAFAARLSAEAGAANASERLAKLERDAQELHATVKLSATAASSTPAAAARQSASALADMQQVLMTRVHLLGVYRGHALKSKDRMRRLTRARSATMQDVIEELRLSAASQMLMELDSTWWSIRDALDKYMETATDQATAYGDAFSVVDAYTSKCTAGFSELDYSYKQAMKAESEAHAQLRMTFTALEKELGLLAAKIEDGEAFKHLARLDAAAVGPSTLGANFSVICQSSDAAALDASRAALTEAFKAGLVSQTWEQLRDIFMEVPLLVDRFLAGGMRAPETQWASQAWHRVTLAFKHAGARTDEIARELLERVRNNDC